MPQKVPKPATLEAYSALDDGFGGPADQNIISDLIDVDAPGAAKRRSLAGNVGARTRIVPADTRPLSTKDSDLLEIYGFSCESSSMIRRR